MAMLPLNELLPSHEKEPYWVFSSDDHEELTTKDDYIILEYYCDNVDCECKSLTASIVRLDDNEVPVKEASAIITYNWATKKTRCKPTLHESSPRTTLARRLLAIYKNFVHSEDYLTRIKNQYAKVKKIAAEKNNASKKHHRHKIVGRNDACICGSGKKFKKCCLNMMSMSEGR